MKLQPPRPPLLGHLEPFDAYPERQVFEQLHLRSLAAWPDYDGEPWQFDGCKLEQCSLADAVLSCIRVWDSCFVRCDLSAVRAFEASLLRSVFLGCRMSGSQWGEGALRDVVFQNCKLNLLSFRSCKLERVSFRDCVLDEADFSSAQLKEVSFVHCSLTKTDFDRAVCRNVDLRQSAIADMRGVKSLAGAHITAEQVVQIAPLLAAEAGILVER